MPKRSARMIIEDGTTTAVFGREITESERMLSEHLNLAVFAAEEGKKIVITPTASCDKAILGSAFVSLLKAKGDKDELVLSAMTPENLQAVANPFLKLAGVSIGVGSLHRLKDQDETDRMTEELAKKLPSDLFLKDPAPTQAATGRIIGELPKQTDTKTAPSAEKIFKIEPKGDYIVVSFTSEDGRVVGANAREFSQRAGRLGATGVVIDLSGVQEIDFTVEGALMQLAIKLNSARPQGKQLKLVGVSERIKKSLGPKGLNQGKMVAFSSLEHALA